MYAVAALLVVWRMSAGKRRGSGETRGVSRGTCTDGAIRVHAGVRQWGDRRTAVMYGALA